MSQVSKKSPPRRPVRPAPKPKKKGVAKKILLGILIAALIAGATVLVVGYIEAHRHYLPVILPKVTQTEAPAEAEA